MAEDSSSDDDVPVSDLMKKISKRKKEEEEEEKDEDGSTDSDVPIKKLVAKKSKATLPPKKKVAPASSKKPAAKVSQATAKKRSGSNRESIFYECARGRLVQALLRRWWYAIDWPGEQVSTKKPEEGFETLPGFPGVHIATSGNRLGDIVDHRDHSKCPCFANLYIKPTSELQALVLKAYDTQIDILAHHEPNSKLLPKLKQERNQAAKINCTKADKEATKAVKAYDDAAPTANKKTKSS